MEHRASLLAGKTAATMENVTRVVAGGTFVLGLTIEQWQSVFGICAAITGIIVTLSVGIATIYYKRKAHQLAIARAQHDGVELKDYDDDE